MKTEISSKYFEIFANETNEFANESRINSPNKISALHLKNANWGSFRTFNYSSLKTLYLAIAESLMNVSLLCERKIVRAHEIWCQLDRRRISCTTGGRFPGTARFGPIGWEQSQNWKIELLQFYLLAGVFEHASYNERSRATFSKNAFSIQELTTTSWAHSLTIGKLDHELKNAPMSWKKWCDDFFDSKFGFYAKNCSRTCTSVANAQEDCTFDGFGNKNHVPDGHISQLEQSIFKTLDLLAAGRWEAETRCEPCHVRGVYHHGGEALSIGYFCLSTLLTTLFSTHIACDTSHGPTFQVFDSFF